MGSSPAESEVFHSSDREEYPAQNEMDLSREGLSDSEIFTLKVKGFRPGAMNLSEC